MTRRLAVLAALTLTMTAGCADGRTGPSAAPSPSAVPSATGAPWHDEIAPAPAGTTVGGKGSGCELPLTFSIGPERTAKPIKAPEGELGELLGEALTRRGGATVQCEVDGRAAGAGFLRVWLTDQPATDPRPALEAFVAGDAKASDPQYRTVRAGAVDAVEASWITTNELIEEKNREWALAVPAGDRTVLLAVSEGLIAEANDVLPGYRLAGRTVAVAG
ncbi:hypothetical protein E1193_05575 [Micromonospora sp. KC606]|uniref:lipoprotein n=1 Tax=Micromonospora sp. KC606 TaxID=2530379 RepID=UPI00104A7E4D|nr:lipoprotein [Micromonospora sp. KC606]TDC84412.1 hypothetical protein E1193_05575 [Micromonospora sp. KC606]